MRNFNSLTFLIIVNSIIFIAAILYQVIFNQGFDNSLFLAFGGFSSIDIRNGELWRLITPNFFHYDVLHFIVNIYSLSRIGGLIKTFYSGQKLFIIYIFGGIASSLLTLVVAEASGNPIFSLGASGSIFALFGVLIGGTIKKTRFGSSLPFDLKDFAIPLLMTFSLGLIPGLRVNNWAHLGGLVAGIIFGLLFKSTYNLIESNLEKGVIKTLYYTSIFFFTISYLVLMLNFINIIFF